MAAYRDLVILAGAEQTRNPESGFSRFRVYAESGGVYLKIGRGAPRFAKPGCNAYVVFQNRIVGVLEYAGVDHSFVPGGNLGGDDDQYVMEPGPALKFVGPFKAVDPPVPYRKGFRGWEYLPQDLEGSITVPESPLRRVLNRLKP